MNSALPVGQMAPTPSLSKSMELFLGWPISWGTFLAFQPIFETTVLGVFDGDFSFIHDPQVFTEASKFLIPEPWMSSALHGLRCMNP